MQGVWQQKTESVAYTYAYTEKCQLLGITLLISTGERITKIILIY